LPISCGGFGRANPHQIFSGVAAEIIRLAAPLAHLGGEGNDFPYVVRLSNTPKPREQLQLAASRILRRPIAIMPVKCSPIQSDGHDHLDPMTVMAALQAAKVKPQYSADQEYRDINESLPIGRAGPGLPGDVLVRGFSRGTK
jgi:hypothetical protein